MTKRTLLLMSMLALGTIFGGPGCNCGGTPAAWDDPGDGGGTPVCETDADCGPGEICSGGSCTTPGDGGGGTDGGGGSCTTSHDCPAGQMCVSGACVPSGDGGTGGSDGGTGGSDGGTGGGSDGGGGGPTSCEDDDQCPAGYECEDHLCVPEDDDDGDCDHDSDCPSGQVCEHGTCVPHCGGGDGGTGGSDGGTGGGSDGGTGGGSDGGSGSGPQCADGKVAVCHYPPGNPGNAHLICIGAPALDAHLAHGDHSGPCP